MLSDCVIRTKGEKNRGLILQSLYSWLLFYYIDHFFFQSFHYWRFEKKFAPLGTLANSNTAVDQD